MFPSLRPLPTLYNALPSPPSTSGYSTKLAHSAKVEKAISLALKESGPTLAKFNGSIVHNCRDASAAKRANLFTLEHTEKAGDENGDGREIYKYTKKSNVF